MDLSPQPKVQLTLEQYRALPHDDRTILRRAAFGAAIPAHVVGEYDLEHLKALLVEDNEATAVMPEKWTAQSDDDELADFLR